MLVIFFGRLDIISKKTRKLSSVYIIRFLFNFIVIHIRVTSIWYHSIILIRDQVIIFVLHQFGIRA